MTLPPLGTWPHRAFARCFSKLEFPSIPTENRRRVSQTKLRVRRDFEIVPRERRSTAEIVPWRMAPARGNESCRWQHFDGRWVSLTLCHGEDLAKVAVEDSSGRRELVDSYEDALALAKSWRV